MAHVANITINNAQVAGDLTDFPVYVNLADLPASFWNVVANGGGDIRIFKADGTTELAREIVSCDTGTDTGEIHFKFSGTLSGSVDTVVQIHADGSSADYAVGATYGRNAVWSGYVSVWHLQSGSTDSTGSNNGTDTSLTNEAGKVGGSASYNGTTSKTLITDNANLRPTAALSISSWIKTSADGAILSNFKGGAGFGYFLIVNGGKLDFRIYSSGANTINAGTSVNDGAWKYVNAVYVPSTSITTYLNGASNETLTTSIKGGISYDSGMVPSIGVRKYSIEDLFFSGNLDEVRFRSSALSTNWITTEYNNQNAPATFYTASSAFNASPMMHLMGQSGGIM